MKNAFQFHGRGGEYFGIWIVNILLTIVTLGLYSPWAHVRNKQYFYGNTELAGERFEYLATGKQIFLGRLIAGVLFIAFSILYQTMFMLSIFILVFMMLLYPWVAQRSLRFNAAMTRYRGVRFGFVGSVKDAYVNFLGKPILACLLGAAWIIITALALTLIYPTLRYALGSPEFYMNIIRTFRSSSVLGFLAWLVMTFVIVLTLFAWVNKSMASFVHNGYLYGDQKFEAQLTTRQFVKNYWLGALIVGVFLVFVIVAFSIITGLMVFGLINDYGKNDVLLLLATVLGFVVYIATFVVMLFVKALIFSKIRNYTYGQTQIGAERAYAFESNIMPSDYAVLLFTNALMVTFSLGFLTPFVRVRVAEFMAQHTAIQGDLNTLVTQEQANVQTGATADALGDVFNLDIQF